MVKGLKSSSLDDSKYGSFSGAGNIDGLKNKIDLKNKIVGSEKNRASILGIKIKKTGHR